MSEFLQDYGFFIVIGILMLACHLWHGGHGKRDEEKGAGGHGHQH